jgi:putative heme iron utilization protein
MNRLARISRLISLQVLALCLLAEPAGADAAPLCASAAQAEAVADLYKTNPVPPPFMAAGQLGLPEAVVASSLPPALAIGVDGRRFPEIWQSLQAWDQALTLVLKGGNVFEIHGRIPPGEPSTRSQFFNLKNDGAGLGGHLRPDLIGAIYALNLTGREGPMRGLTFVDQKGEGIFGVFLPEGRDPPPALVAQFERTWGLMAAMPRACPRP